MTIDLEPPTDANVPEPVMLDGAPPLPRPRIRWAAIVWGLVLASVAASVLWIVLSPARRDGIVDWFAGLSPAAIAAYVLLVIGGFALIAGVVGLIRRFQRRVERGRIERERTE